MNCAACKFWNVSAEHRANVKRDDSAQCRRHAPVLDNQVATRPLWPWTRDGDWCGDFEYLRGLEPCAECGQPSGLDALRYGNGDRIVCKKCDDARPRFDGPIPL